MKRLAKRCQSGEQNVANPHSGGFFLPKINVDTLMLLHSKDHTAQTATHPSSFSSIFTRVLKFIQERNQTYFEQLDYR